MTGWYHASEIQVGDVVSVWWNPGRDTVTNIRPYKGPLKCMQGGWIFEFALLPSRSMSVSPIDRFERVHGAWPKRKS